MQNNIKIVVAELLKQDTFNISALRKCGFSHCSIRQFKKRHVFYEKTISKIINTVFLQRREIASKQTAQQVYSWAVKQKMNKDNMKFLFNLDVFDDALVVAAFWLKPTIFNEILENNEKR